MSQPAPDAPSPKDLAFFATLDASQLDSLKKFWRRFDALLCPSDDSPVDPADKSTQALMSPLGPERFRAAFQSWVMMDDPDVLVGKFIRARKWDLTPALKLLIGCLKWRIERNVDGIVENESIRRQFQTGKTFVHGVDRSGCPIVRVAAGKHRTKDQTSEEAEEFIIYSMEVGRLFMVPPTGTATLLTDVTGFGTQNMDYKCATFLINCLQTYYPETLNLQIIHNAPRLFNGMWKILSGMLDPVVASKVQFTQSKGELSKWIDEKNLLESQGGSSDYEWNYSSEAGKTTNAPLVDVETKEKELDNRRKLVEMYLELTRKWVAIGSSEGVQAEVVKVARTRDLVRLMLRAHYFKLMPYIKPLTVYHHQKTLTYDQPGVIKFKLNSTAPDGSLILGEDYSRAGVLKMIDQKLAEFDSDGITRPSVDFEL